MTTKLMYPLNLEADEYGGNMVVYHIYEPYTDTKNTTSERTSNLGTIPEDNRGALIGSQVGPKAYNTVIGGIKGVISSAGSAAASAGSAVGSAVDSAVSNPGAVPGAIGGAIGTGLEMTGKAAIAAPGAIAAGVGAVGQGAVNYLSGIGRVFDEFKVTQYKQAKETIFLYMPPRLEMTYDASWEAKDLGTWAAAANVFTDSNSMGTSLAAAAAGGFLVKTVLGGNISDYIPSLAALYALGTEGKQAASVVGQSVFKPEGMLDGVLGGIGGFLSKITGIVGNPMSEMLFTNMKFRKFYHNFEFFPRSKAEAEAVNKIIYTFKYHMHPEFKLDPYLYLYPSEFQIDYMTNGDHNKSLPRMARCALTSAEVTYGERNQYTSLPDGTPAHIKLRLEFNELAILTKEQIAQGC